VKSIIVDKWQLNETIINDCRKIMPHKFVCSV